MAYNIGNVVKLTKFCALTGHCAAFDQAWGDGDGAGAPPPHLIYGNLFILLFFTNLWESFSIIIFDQAWGDGADAGAPPPQGKIPEGCGARHGCWSVAMFICKLVFAGFCCFCFG